MTFDTKGRPDPAASPTNPSTFSEQQSSNSGPSAASRGGRRPAFIPTLLGALALATGTYFVGRNSAPHSKPVSVSAAPPSDKGGSKQAPRDGEAGGASRDPDKMSEADAADSAITLDADAAKTAGIQTQSVRSALLRETLSVPGTVEVSPNGGARVTPPVAGKILALYAVPGDRVTAGQRLALLDSPEVAQAHAAVREAQSHVADATAQVQTAQAREEQAKSRRGSAQASLQRQRELARTGAFSQPSLQTAQSELNTAQSELAQAQTDIQAQTVIVGRNQRLFDAQVVAKAELEQSQVAKTQAQNRVDQAARRVDLARQSVRREQKIFRSGLLTRQAIQSSEADVRTAEGEVRQSQKQEQAAQTSLGGARDRLGAARANLRAVEGDGQTEGAAGHLAVKAPIGGTIASRTVTLGQAVERSTDLFMIQNIESVVVAASVPEASVARVQVGAPVTVTVAAYPNTRFSGVVQSAGSAVSEKTRTLTLRCIVRNRGGALRPEMFARVNLTIGRQTQGLVVPDAAVDEDNAKRFVYVREGEKYEKREIQVGRTAHGLVEVSRGLKAGEEVVTTGLFVLKSESKKDELKGDGD